MVNTYGSALFPPESSLRENLMKIFDPIQSAQALPYDQLVPAMAQAALELARRQIQAPERQVVAIDAASVLLSMPAIGSDISVTKLITVHANNAQHGLPAIQGEVIIFETATGRRLALLDGPTVTARRTAAVTLLGIRTLAPQRPSSALLIGTGAQAAEHAEALITYFGVSRFWIVARDGAKAQAFCDALRSRHPQVTAIALAASSLQTELPPTDVVIALTSSRTPVIPASIGAATLAIGVGAFKSDMAEFPPELLHRRQIVVDDLDGARHEAGDLIQAQVDWSQVCALSSLLDGTVKPGEPLPVFKTVGQAAWDLAAARVAIATLG
jgi:1-piperideine-2-carboxylate/1-pyrroline-2-carboxylate reductase [NAD(P)H]